MLERDDSNRLLAVPVVLILIVLAGILGLAALACTVTSQVPAAAPTSTPQTIDVVIPNGSAPTTTPAPLVVTATPALIAATQTPVIIVQQEIVTVPVPVSVTIPTNCAVRGDWVAYTVLPGDTLGGLAIATNTALADLIVGNCLQNPDLIQVGQVIYLPRALTVTNPVVTVVPGLTSPTIGFVLVEPALVQSSSYVVAPGDIVIRAQNVSNARQVTFYMAPIGGNAPPTVLGIDENLADGAALLWRISTPFSANVWATATSPDNLEYSTDPILVVNNG